MAVVWKKLAFDADLVTTFVGLTDTPANFTSAASKLVVVNGTPDALEFVPITDFLEGTPTEDLATKAPTSEWAFDHNAKKAANAVLGHVMVETASLIDVDGDGKLTLGAHVSTHEHDGSDPLALDELAVPDAAVDFDLQEATDLVIMKVADAAARNALAAAATEVGQILWQTDTGEVYVCVTSEA